MYEVEIEFPDGSKDTFDSFTLDALMRALDKCEILSFKIQLRHRAIDPNPFRKKP